jgi:MFS family permease
MPFFALLSMYSIWKVWRLGYWRWLIVTGVSLALVLQSHYLGLLLAPTITFFWLMAYVKKTVEPNSKLKYSILSLVLFVFIMSPLLVFDLHPDHRWLNLSALTKFFSDRTSTVNLKPYKALPNIVPLYTQINSSLLTAKSSNSYYATLLTISLMLGSLVFLISKRNPDFLFVFIWILTGLIGLALYKQHIYDHYFGFIFPAVFLILGFFIKALSLNFPSKAFVILILIAMSFLNLSNSPLRYPPNNQLKHTSMVASLIHTDSGGAPFNLALLSKNNYDQSYRYFLSLLKSPYYSIHTLRTSQLYVVCEMSDCQPIGNPLWEIAAYGWAKIDRTWEFPWGVKLYRLIPNPSGQPT